MSSGAAGALPAPVPSPAVTVAIPVYNSAATLARAIDSVLTQTLGDLELLVVDDGSSDDSLQVARTQAANDPRVRIVVLGRNGGKARAMNYAAEIAAGTWIAVLDADDRYLPARLATMVEAGEAAGVDLVADNQIHIDDATGKTVRTAFDAAGAGRTIGLRDFIAHSNPGAPFDFGILKPMVRKEFLRRTKLHYHPEAKLAEDFYYLLEFFALGGRGFMVHEPLYQWTLPFSPTARRWTATGNGAWRYDYRNALETNRYFQGRMAGAVPPEIAALLRRRDRDYQVMVHYLDAQRVIADTGNYAKALGIIATHPRTWGLLGKRVTNRVLRQFAQGR